MNDDAKSHNCKVNWELSMTVSANNILDLSKHYDAVILTAGASIKYFWAICNDSTKLPVTYCAGQNLVYDSQYRNKAILRGNYIVPYNQNPSSSTYQVLCGSTKEYLKEFPISNSDEYPSNISKATALLHTPISELDPSLTDAKPVSCFGGIRVVTKRTTLGRIPIIDKFPMSNFHLNQLDNKNNVWFISGLGSRGLIHHALMATWLFDAVTKNDPDNLPLEVRLEYETKGK